jgi:predicted phosphohydrolase
MSIFAISDLHLSTLDKTNKSMEIFGQRWADYIRRIKVNWERLVNDTDTVIIPGDISWALSLEEAKSDLMFLDSLPGKKILGKGNHDFWWSTMKKHDAFFKLHSISSISFLHNNAHETENVIVAGTRGWFVDDEARNAPENADFQKLVNRETLRLEASLKEAYRLSEQTGKEIIGFMHFPPYWNERPCESMINLFLKYGVKRVYFGHIHGNYTLDPVTHYLGIEMNLISADYLGFIPKIIK